MTIKERLFTPKHTHLPDGLPDSYVFQLHPPKHPDYASVPMESGKIGLFNLLEIHTPRDPGDMHIARWEFIKYLKKEKL